MTVTNISQLHKPSLTPSTMCEVTKLFGNQFPRFCISYYIFCILLIAPLNSSSNMAEKKRLYKCLKG